MKNYLSVRAFPRLARPRLGDIARSQVNRVARGRNVIIIRDPKRPRYNRHAGLQLPWLKRAALMRACPRRATSFESGMIYGHGFLRRSAIRHTDREMTGAPLLLSLVHSLFLSLRFIPQHTRCIYLRTRYALRDRPYRLRHPETRRLFSFRRHGSVIARSRVSLAFDRSRTPRGQRCDPYILAITIGRRISKYHDVESKWAKSWTWKGPPRTTFRYRTLLSGELEFF